MPVTFARRLSTNTYKFLDLKERAARFYEQSLKNRAAKGVHYTFCSCKRKFYNQFPVPVRKMEVPRVGDGHLQSHKCSAYRQGRFPRLI